MSAVTKVLLAEPRGFCAGVEMAVKALAWMVELYDPPVYCYHEIVHNRTVTRIFQQAGVVFVDDVDSVPPGAPLMLSAHGSAPEVVEAARRNGRTVVDAVCPLVTKVHHEVKVRSREGFDVVYVGHEGHDEAVGTMAVAPDSVRLVQTAADVDALEDSGRPVALLAQTTLSLDDWAEVREAVERRFEKVWTPGRSDLCFATTNRQMAVKEMASLVDSIVVIGSRTSSNTDALELVARNSQCPRVERIDTARDLPDDLAGIVGITSGASVPEQLVQEVIALLDPAEPPETVRATTEDEYFPLPSALRELLAEVGLEANRATTASSVLGRLARRRASPG